MADNHKSNKGFTVSELESKMQKHGPEICFCAMFILAAIFALIWSGMILSWSILLTMILGIVGVLIPKHVHKAIMASLHFIYKEKVTSLVAAVIGLLISILLPPLVFALVGAVAGRALITNCSSCCDDSCDLDKK